MSKRQEIRERRRRQQLRNRIIIILLIVVGALLVTYALILPSINTARNAANATKTAANFTPPPVISITPKSYNTKVDGVHLGDPNAPVKLDVFSDFRCSACLSFVQNIEPVIILDYVETGKVYYSVYNYIVIDGHDGTDASLRSANAAMCASEQNRYWDYHATLFANQTTEDAYLFSDARLTTMAENLKLDMTAFNQCFKERKYNSKVQQDIEQGRLKNITFTPSVFVNGELIKNFSQTGQAIDTALAGN